MKLRFDPSRDLWLDTMINYRLFQQLKLIVGFESCTLIFCFLIQKSMSGRLIVDILPRCDHSSIYPLEGAQEGLRQQEPQVLFQVRLSHSLTQPHQNINKNQCDKYCRNSNPRPISCLTILRIFLYHCATPLMVRSLKLAIWKTGSLLPWALSKSILMLPSSLTLRLLLQFLETTRVISLQLPPSTSLQFFRINFDLNLSLIHKNYTREVLTVQYPMDQVPSPPKHDQLGRGG